MRVKFKLPVEESYKGISGYGIIGNMRTAALVGYDGSIDWCCMPRFDSPSVFAAILDCKRGGRWAISPSGSAASSQRYLEGTNILRTEFYSRKGEVILTDFMPCSIIREAWSTPPEIHRIVECVKGEMDIRFVFKPTFDYGRVRPHIETTKNGLVMTDTKSEMILSWSAPLASSDTGIDCVFPLSEGKKKIFVLSYGEAVPRPIRHYHSERRQATTKAFWHHWLSQLKYTGKWKDMIVRSALTLKLLVYSPTGAIIAAPTTSLPEALDGNRNWDYRYSWIRDSANSLWAFHVLGYTSESDAYLHWLIDNNAALDLDLRLMYAIDGGDSNLKETALKHLEGYRGSRPVRIGNDAAEQLQLDACGYMLDALYFSTRHVHSINDEMYYRFVKPLARHIVESWEKPSNGIWEIRNRQEHYVYTKAWCFAGLDRAARIAKMSGHLEDSQTWTAVMRKIKAEVIRKGWSGKKKSFVMQYGDTHLDAANLMLPLIGFLPANDKRMKRTIEATKKELSRGALVYRYRAKDGLRGNEGAFLLCGFWLVVCLARLGRINEAQRNFNELITYANHLGLYSEEVDPESGEALGNFPQAFSHMGFIMAARELQIALTRTRNQRVA